MPSIPVHFEFVQTEPQCESGLAAALSDGSAATDSLADVMKNSVVLVNSTLTLVGPSPTRLVANESVRQLELRHALGYARLPQSADEVGAWLTEQDWDSV